jgi:hypothetical protein
MAASGPLQIGFKQALPGRAPQSLSIALDSHLVHALVHMLEKGMGTALWLDAPQAADGKPLSPTAAPRPRYVN